METITYQLPQSQALTALRAQHRLGGSIYGIVNTSAPTQIQAGCSHGHVAPDPNCSCGYGLADDLAELDSCEYLQDRDAPFLCLVKAWGQIVIDEPSQGATFRAQFCQVQAVADISPLDPATAPQDELDIQAVAALYGVPVLSEADLFKRLATANPTLESQRRQHLPARTL